MLAVALLGSPFTVVSVYAGAASGFSAALIPFGQLAFALSAGPV